MYNMHMVTDVLAEIEKNRSYERGANNTEREHYWSGIGAMWEHTGALDSPEAMTSELAQLLGSTADSMASLTQDDRDGITDAIDYLTLQHDLTTDQQNKIGEEYINMVGSLSKDEDWVGNPLFVAEIGDLLRVIIGKGKDPVRSMQLRGRLSQAWSDYKAGVALEQSEKDMMLDKSRGLDPLIAKVCEDFFVDEAHNDFGEFTTEREAPSHLNEAQTELLVWYDESLKGGAKSAKLPVFNACSNYREKLKNRGVDISKFWNIADPDEQIQALETIMENPMASKVFKAQFEEFFGEDYTDLSDEQKRAIADELEGLVQLTAGSIQARMPDFNKITDNIIGQVSEAKDLQNPGRKLKPVLKWIKQVFPEFGSKDPEEIEAFIEHNLDSLREFYGEKSKDVEEAMGVILDASKPNMTNVRFMNRDMFDLKSGNLTADCTAWNLDLGFNAHTVPVWVTNPTFNFAYIYDGGTIVAKFGMILSFDSKGQPQVFIDSIETNKNLPADRENTAMNSIDTGFSHLQDWADRNGFGTLRVCTFTNSTELTANLPIIESEEDDRIFNFDGLLATGELLGTLGDEKIKENDIYLQSTYSDGDVMEHEEELEEAEATTVEKWIQDSLRTISDRQYEDILLESDNDEEDFKVSAISEEEFMGLLRSGDKDKILSAFIAISNPFIYHRYEITVAGLQQVRDEPEDTTYAIGPNVRNPHILDKFLKLKPGNQRFEDAEHEDSDNVRKGNYDDYNKRTKFIENQILHTELEPSSFTLEEILDFYLDEIDFEQVARLLFGTNARRQNAESEEDSLVLPLKSNFPIYNRQPAVKA